MGAEADEYEDDEVASLPASAAPPTVQMVAPQVASASAASTWSASQQRAALLQVADFSNQSHGIAASTDNSHDTAALAYECLVQESANFQTQETLASLCGEGYPTPRSPLVCELQLQQAPAVRPAMFRQDSAAFAYETLAKEAAAYDTYAPLAVPENQNSEASQPQDSYNMLGL